MAHIRKHVDLIPAAECSGCGHFKTAHIEGMGCLICMGLIKMTGKGRVCHEVYPLKLGLREIEQARMVSKDAYEGMQPCAVCDHIWWAHTGLICPNGETLFVPAIGSSESVRLLT